MRRASVARRASEAPWAWLAARKRTTELCRLRPQTTLPEVFPQDTPEALPYPFLRRMSSPSQSRAGLVAPKGRCRVGREVTHPGPSPDPDKEISTIRLFR